MTLRPPPRTILIVDDNEPVLRATARLLRARGLEVITSDTPFGVTALVRRYHPAVIVLDVCMPALDGVALARLIRSNTGQAAIVLHSALPEEQLYAHARSIEGASYVQKSDGPRALLEAVQRRLQ